MMADLGKITLHITTSLNSSEVDMCNEIFDRYLRERPHDLKIVINNRAGDCPPVWIDVEKAGEEE